MANLLRKTPSRTVVGGSPAVPAVPGYSYMQRYETRVSTGGLNPTYICIGSVCHPSGFFTFEYKTVVTYVKVTVPAKAGSPAIPGIVLSVGEAGWDGGARSIGKVEAGQFFRGTTPKGAIAMIVGLATDSPVRNRQWIEYGVRLEKGVDAKIVEAGLTVQTIPGVRPTSAHVIEVRRAGNGVYYLVDGVMARFTQVTDNRDLYGSAMLYTEVDTVDDPLIMSLATASLDCRVPPPIPTMYEGVYRAISGRVPPPAMTLASSRTETGDLAGRVPKLIPVIYGRDDTELPVAYGVMLGQVPLPSLYLTMQDEVISYVKLTGLSPRPVGSLHGITGEVGSIAAQVRPPAGLMFGGFGGSLRGAMRGTWPSNGYAGEVIPMPTANLALGYVHLPKGVRVAGEFKLDHPVVVILHEGIGVGSVIDLQVINYAEAHDAIIASGGITLAAEILEAMLSTVYCDSGVRGTVVYQAGSTPAPGVPAVPFNPAALGYAVNIITGALTEYADADFSHITRMGNELWAVKSDGIYRLSDSGTLSALIDFGITDGGNQQRKHTTKTYVGIRTDGQVYLRVIADGVESVYRAEGDGDIKRFTMARGVTARNWSFQLELSDASFATIDSAEFLIGTSARRMGGRE